MDFYVYPFFCQWVFSNLNNGPDCEPGKTPSAILSANGISSKPIQGSYPTLPSMPSLYAQQTCVHFKAPTTPSPIVTVTFSYQDALSGSPRTTTLSMPYDMPEFSSTGTTAEQVASCAFSSDFNFMGTFKTMTVSLDELTDSIPMFPRTFNWITSKITLVTVKVLCLVGTPNFQNSCFLPGPDYYWLLAKVVTSVQSMPTTTYTIKDTTDNSRLVSKRTLRVIPLELRLFSEYWCFGLHRTNTLTLTGVYQTKPMVSCWSTMPTVSSYGIVGNILEFTATRPYRYWCILFGLTQSTASAGSVTVVAHNALDPETPPDGNSYVPVLSNKSSGFFYIENTWINSNPNVVQPPQNWVNLLNANPVLTKPGGNPNVPYMLLDSGTVTPCIKVDIFNPQDPNLNNRLPLQAIIASDFPFEYPLGVDANDTVAIASNYIPPATLSAVPNVISNVSFSGQVPMSPASSPGSRVGNTLASVSTLPKMLSNVSVPNHATKLDANVSHPGSWADSAASQSVSNQHQLSNRKQNAILIIVCILTFFVILILIAGGYYMYKKRK